MTTLQQQARALGDPTRYAIFRHLADADDVVGIAELSEHFELNHNAIRQHPGKLIAEAMDREGFDPTVRARGSRVEIVLRTCPFASTAVAEPDTVCSLHLGIARRRGDEGTVQPRDTARRSHRAQWIRG